MAVSWVKRQGHLASALAPCTLDENEHVGQGWYCAGFDLMSCEVPL